MFWHSSNFLQSMALHSLVLVFLFLLQNRGLQQKKRDKDKLDPRSYCESALRENYVIATTSLGALITA